MTTPTAGRAQRPNWLHPGRLAAVLACGLSLPGGLVAVSGPPVGAASTASPDAAGVTWLCRPGQAGDPCLFPEGSVSVAANGAKTVVPAPAPATAQSAFDCFYIYPTVTASAATSNTGTAVTLAVEAAAVEQASRFSQVCNVWAPTYRQRTSASLEKGMGNDPTADQISYDSLLAGWKDYLAHDNDGRPVIFIGHSQGAANLIKLLRSQVDDNRLSDAGPVHPPRSIDFIRDSMVDSPTKWGVPYSELRNPRCDTRGE